MGGGAWASYAQLDDWRAVGRRQQRRADEPSSSIAFQPIRVASCGAVNGKRLVSWIAFGLWAVAPTWSAPAQTNEWKPLYNGQNLDGWVQRGGKAKYRAEGAELVGTSVPNTPNSFLCTTRVYTNFILEFEFKVAPELNSGVQIRSQCFEEARRVEWQGRSIAIPAGRVHGYQVEIDADAKRARWWTGGIYDEGRRGWLFPGPLGGDAQEFTRQGGQAFKPGDWNHIRVEAIGDSIKTWLNGVLRAQIKDDLTPAGFIALQVHGVGKRTEPLEVRWRNLRIRELP